MTNFDTREIKTFVPAKDYELSISFYKDIIGLPVFYSNPEIGWAQFDVGGAYIGLERCDPKDPDENIITLLDNDCG